MTCKITLNLESAYMNCLWKNKLEVLGNPLPVTKEVDWDNSTNFEFEFDMGLAPDFKVSLDKKIKFDYLKIVADQKMVNHYTNDMAKR